MCKSCKWEEAKEIAEDLLELLEDLPSEADDFVDGVREKTDSMLDWVTSNEHVTEKMITALENMTDGAMKWVHKD